MGRDRGLHPCRRGEDRLGVLAVPLASELDHRGPGRREQPARSGPLDARRAVLTPAPGGLEEILAVAQRLVVEAQHARALEPVAVFVCVGRHRGHAGDRQVERGQVIAELAAERQDEPAQAPVDVEPNPASDRELAERLDRVNGAVPVVARRAHERDGVIVDVLGDPVEVYLGRHRIHRCAPQLHAEEVACLVERRVGGLRLDQVRRPGARRGVLAVREYRVDDGVGPSRGHEPDGLRVAATRRTEQVERHRDDLGLELRSARAHVALQRVHVGEAAECLVDEVVVLVVPAVHRAGALPGLPERVFLLRHDLQLAQDLLPGPAPLG